MPPLKSFVHNFSSSVANCAAFPSVNRAPSTTLIGSCVRPKVGVCVEKTQVCDRGGLICENLILSDGASLSPGPLAPTLTATFPLRSASLPLRSIEVFLPSRLEQKRCICQCQWVARCTTMLRLQWMNHCVGRFSCERTVDSKKKEEMIRQ